MVYFSAFSYLFCVSSRNVAIMIRFILYRRAKIKNHIFRMRPSLNRPLFPMIPILIKNIPGRVEKIPGYFSWEFLSEA
jgi:hypothetical protein